MSIRIPSFPLQSVSVAMPAGKVNMLVRGGSGCFARRLAQTRGMRTMSATKSISSEPEPTVSSSAQQSSALLLRFQDSVRTIFRQGDEVESILAEVGRGDSLSPGRLLQMQEQVYHYSRELESVSRVVEGLSQSIRTLMQTQI